MLKCCILLKRCVMLCLDGVADASRDVCKTFEPHPSLPAWEVAISLVLTETLRNSATGLVG